jgi:protein-S-isoprenylcysteine O-methyltransferase Ste14
MSNSFVQRGGWWVVGQFLLLLAIGILDITGQAALKPLPIFIGGLVLIVIATLVSLAGLLALGRNLTPFPKPSAKTELVQHGIYALIRHPLYTSVFCAAVGSSFIFQSWPALAVSAALGLFFDAKARHEEHWLRQQFPDYAGYERRVRRFIPWIY